MPRYLLFGGDTYYPGGGWEDYRGGFDSVEDALRAAARGSDWWHIVDLESGRIIEDQEGSRRKGTSLGSPAKFIIMARCSGQPAEEVDEADTLEDAKHLVGEYRMAFGGPCTVWYKRARG